MLIYAGVPGMDEHEVSRAWLTAQFNDPDGFVGLAWPSLFAFVRIVSNRRIMGEDAVDLPGAWQAAEAYRRQRNARLLDAGPRHPYLVRELISTPGLASDDVPDVHLAAVAIEHGVVLCSHDHGFARFDGLRWKDPIRPGAGGRK